MQIKPHTLSEIAALLQSKFTGSPDLSVTGLNEVHMVEPGDLMFVDHPKYYDKALKSAATTILINKEVDCPPGKGLIFCEEPFTAFNQLIKYFSPQVRSLKPVSDTAVIGENTVIHPNVYIGNQVTIGKNSVLMPGVVLYDYVHIGDHVTIHAGAVLGSHAFYYKKRADQFEKLITCGRVIIHDHVEIGACCTIDAGVTGDTVIGKHTKLDNQVHIGHDTIIGEMCLLAAQVGVAGVCKIGNRVTIWGQVGIASDLEIGDGAVIMAQSGISKDVAPGSVQFGSPSDDSRQRLREMAALRQLPELMAQLRSKA
jgi:UDP-3-O-[3-hydroxymyristoyl] glucosamine N-acyltransferase